MPSSSCLNLFAYGTLMDRDRLAWEMVVPPAEVERRLRIRVAEAIGFRRVFNRVVPQWGGAVLNLEFDKTSTVVGVLYMDLTHQELGMLDSSQPYHLPRKPLEVLVEGEKVPALAYMARPDAGAAVAESYETQVLELVRRLGDPILANFLEHTYQSDGAPRYRKLEAAPPAEATTGGTDSAAGPASTVPA